MASERGDGGVPFAGYVTTNYDGLLEVALREVEPGPSGWRAVGNQYAEARDVSSDSQDVVWHIHGALSLPADKSKLILTDSDYDQLYGGTTVPNMLGSLIDQNRVVFIGFGFGDPDFERLLHTVRQRTVPTRPLFAFLGGDVWKEEERRSLLVNQNVRVIPYQVRGGSHAQLADLLGVYAALTLSRSLTLGQGRVERPGFDPATTGLLLYNELVLKDQTSLGGNVLDLLVRTRVLALLDEGPSAVSAIVADVLQDVGQVGRADRAESVGHAVSQALNDLRGDGFVRLGAGGVFSLTDRGTAEIRDQAHTARALDDAFRRSLSASRSYGEPTKRPVGGISPLSRHLTRSPSALKFWTHTRRRVSAAARPRNSAGASASRIASSRATPSAPTCSTYARRFVSDFGSR